MRTSGRRRRDDDPSARAFEDDAGDQWLLIHKRDEHAVAGWDAEDHPQSVKTGRTNDDVKGARDALWNGQAPAAAAEIDLTGAVVAPMPTNIEPMLATLASKPFSDPDWLFEIKWDGYRLQAVVADRKVRTWTRNLRDAATYFPRLLAAPTWIEAREAIVDGEVMALDDAGRPDFGLLQERLGDATAHGLVYQAFDLLYLDGRSLLNVPLEDRKRLLRSVLRPHPRVRFAAHVSGEGLAFYEAARAQGLEGVIAKLKRSRYEPGRRSAAWLKLKIRPEQELVIGGWTPGEGNARDLGAVVVGVHEDGRLRFSGKVGSGFTGATRAGLLARLKPLEVEEPPFDPAPSPDSRGRWGGDLRDVHWVRPELVIRAELGGWSRDGMVRQAAFKGIEEGRDRLMVVRETAVATAAAVRAAGGSEAAAPSAPNTATSYYDIALSRGTVDADQLGEVPGQGPATAAAVTAVTADELDALARLDKEGVWRIGGHELKLTNLDKPLFEARRDGSGGPHEGPITKRELISYFARIAPTMLPHLADRPLNLQRFPNGAGAPGFWQKDIPATAPAWLRRWRETGLDGREDRDANDHLIADRAATLAWLGNQASFEIHAWTGRLPEPWQPTFALIDIDPGDRTTWEETLTLARLFRTALAHLGVRGYPKTTGKRGLQVWIPVEQGRYDFAATSTWVERISRAPSARSFRTSSRGSGRRRRARAAPGSITRRTRASRPSSRRTPSGPRRARPSPRRSPGTSSTIRTCAPIAGRSGRSSIGLPNAAISSRQPRPTGRNSPKSDAVTPLARGLRQYGGWSPGNIGKSRTFSVARSAPSSIAAAASSRSTVPIL